MGALQPDVSEMRQAVVVQDPKPNRDRFCTRNTGTNSIHVRCLDEERKREI
jgi:hypothetical protein